VKRLVILLIIALLPLRGWAGDLMSVQMAAGGLPAQVGAMPADCPMLSVQVDAGDVSQAPTGPTGCASCDLCLPMAELASQQFGVITFAAHTAPAIDGVDFCSAATALAFKPPIS
jgi:hypothetical protein